MRLPSIEQLARTAFAAARRFPVALTCAVISALSASLLADSPVDEELLAGILYAASLGIPLFIAITLTAERRGVSNAVLWGARGIAAALLLGVYLGRPTWSEPVQVLRYVQLSVAAHLLVAVAPYAAVREWNGFWQYNRSLFLRFLLAGVFSAVLYLGLSVALLAVDNLLGIDVEGETYFRLWCWIAFVFSAWFFLSGVPEDFEELEREDDYPAVLKVFSQYILSPLVTVYILILTLYLGRIIITRVWPSGWIGYLVSSVAAAGILSLLLLYPIAEREENHWVQRYARWFWIGLIPANIMLLLAIWKRIQQYAITEPRYFLVVLSLWLGGMSLFYAITRSRNIKVIPATLAAIALLTFIGPWSAYPVSRASQTSRLEGLLEKNGMLVDGQVRPPSADVSAEDRREIGATIRYLAANHGTGSIESWFPAGRLAEVDTIADGTQPSDRWEAEGRAALIVEEMGIEYVGTWTPGEGEGFNFFVEQSGPPLPIEGYDYVLRNRSAVLDTVRVDETGAAFAWDEDRLSVTMSVEGEEVLVVSLEEVLRSAHDYMRTRSAGAQVPAELLTARAESEGARLAVAVSAIGGYLEDDETPYRVNSLTADYYFRLATPEDGSASPDD